MNKTRVKYSPFIALLLLIAQAGFSIPAGGRHVLFSEGNTDYQIVVDANASVGEKRAAGEIAKYLGEISGADFGIVNESGKADAEIVVGHAAASKLIELPKPDGKDEGFRIFNQGKRIFIVGGEEHGTLYGIYAFLEEFLGCRWYTSKVAVVPERDSFGFDEIDIRQKPAIQFRSVDYVDYWLPEVAVPNKNNAQFHGTQASPYIEQMWLEHSFRFFVPADECFGTHPEYFSLIDGERQKEVVRSDGRKMGTQLCLTNPDVLKRSIEGLRKYIREHPQYTVYNIAQNDNKNPCQCENCQKIVKREDAESGLMLWFVNQVVEAVEDEFPGKRFATFAYQYTRQPPRKIRPHKDLIIVLCSIECDYSHPFDHPNNVSFLEDLRNWQDLTDNILIWDYVVNFRHYFLPHPNFNVLQKNIQILRDAGVAAVLEQANGLGWGGEFGGLRGWVLAKLLWNPDADMRALIEDYINGYYQKSAPHILQYFDLVQSLATEDSFITYATKLDNPIFTSGFLEKANGIFDKAEASADNEEILHRVEVARLGVIYMNLMTDLGNSDKKAELCRLVEITSREKIVWSSEGGTMEKLVEKLRREIDGE
ncbi:MAG: DUF4838 domain-containing protein [Verrucomicrobiota bacterium]